MPHSGRPLIRCFYFFVTFTLAAFSQSKTYPSNGTSCDQCHSTPVKFGSSALTVHRVGSSVAGSFVPGSQGGIHHRRGEATQANQDQIAGERVSVNLLGDGYVEAIDDRDLLQIAERQHSAKKVIAGISVNAPILESEAPKSGTRTGRFGWKSQHSSLLSACADSLRNELGIRNRLYPDEYSNTQGE